MIKYAIISTVVCIILIGIIVLMIYFSIIKNKKNKNKDAYEKDINDIKKEGSAHEEIIVNSTIDDYNDNGTRKSGKKSSRKNR